MVRNQRHARRRVPLRAAFTAVAALLLAVSFVGAAVAADQGTGTPITNDYALVIDASDSMANSGIDDDVKNAVNDFIQGLPLGSSTVLIYPFNDGLVGQERFDLKTDADKQAAQDYVSQISHAGKTKIYSSVQTVFEDLSRIREEDPGTRHDQQVLLYTDGQERGDSHTLKEVLRDFEGSLRKNPFMGWYWIQLKGDVPADLEDKEKVYPEKGFVAPSTVLLTPQQLDFGSYFGMGSSGQQTRTLDVRFNKDLRGSAFTLSAVSDAASKKGLVVSVEPRTITLEGSPDAAGLVEMQREVTLSVADMASGSAGDFTGQIEFAVAKKGPAADRLLPILTPPSLGFSFTTKSVVAIAWGTQGFKGAFGTVDPYASGSDTATTEQQVVAKFDPAVEEGQGSVELSLVPVSTPDGATDVQVGFTGTGKTATLTPDKPSATVRISVPAGQTAGDYAYAIKLVPSTGLVLSGVPLKGGAGLMPVSLSVPVAPPSTLSVVLRWVIIALIALAILLVILFVALMFYTGLGPAALLVLISRRLRPRMGDARIEVTAPDEAVGQYELSEERRFDVGPTSKGLVSLPCTVRFEPQISVLQGSDDVKVSIVNDGAADGLASFLTIVRSSGIEELTSESTVADCDVVRVDMSDGRRCELVFRSIKYLST